MSVRHSAARALLLTAGVLPLGACEWFTDFKRQPSIVTWEALDSAGVRGNPQTSVPITGTAVPGFAVSYGMLPATIDSMANIPNPVPADAASIANGRKYYTINCAVCHGMTGQGDGTATRYGVFPFPLVGARPQGLSDGYIFGMIRNGRGNMPPYNRIEERDRWDVVNYVRALQGAGGATPETGPLAAPGVTGQAVPGATTLGPTRPAPHTTQGMPSAALRDTAPRSPADTATRTAGAAARQGEQE